MKKFNYTILAVALLMSACGDDAGKSDSEGGNETGKTSSGSTSGPSCLANYHGKPSQLLTDDMINNIDELKKFNFEKDVSEMDNMKNYSNVSYSEPSDRKIMMGGSSYNVDNEVTLSAIMEVDVYGDMSVTEAFESMHQNMTEEEIKAAMGAIKKQAGNNEAVEDEVEEKVENETLGVIGEQMLKANYVKVDVGDMAFFEEHESKLSVLHGKWSFILITNLSDDKAFNRSVALKLAKQILEKCNS